MFICNNCSKQYKSKGCYDKHVIACVPAIAETEPERVEEVVEEAAVETLACNNCSKQYKNKTCYDKHIKTCMPEPEQEEQVEGEEAEFTFEELRDEYMTLMSRYNELDKRNKELEAIAETHKNCIPGGQRIVERTNNYNMTNNININVYNYNLIYPDGRSINLDREYEVMNDERDAIDYHGMPLIQNKDSLIDLIGDSIKQALKEAFKYI